MSGRPSRAEDQGADDAVVADSEAFEAQDPGDGALDHQAVSIQMSFGLDPTAGNTHFEPSPVLCRSYAGASTVCDGVVRSA